MENIENKVRQEFEADRRELDESELAENELDEISGGGWRPNVVRWFETDDGPNIARHLDPFN
jgi:hypothetical protein